MPLLDDLTGNFLGGLFSSKGINDPQLARALGGFDSSTGDVDSSQFNFSKYDVTSLTYPSDLLSNINGELASKNYVMFFINVSTDSKVLKQQQEEVFQGDVSRIRSQLLSEGITQKGLILAGGVLGGVTGAVGSKISGVVGKKISGKLSTALGAGVGAGAAGIISLVSGDTPPGEEKQPQFTRPQKRLKKAIALYVPHNLKVTYGVNYESTDTAGFSAAASGASEVADALSSKGKGSIKDAAGIGTDFLVSKILGAGQFGAGAGIVSGLAANPKKEQQFQGVNFREFTFNYTFAPRDEQEARIVRNIIYEFKYHMHPEFLNPSAFVYVYPSEFDIEYYNGASTNPNIHKHTSCVLVNMEVDYAPNNNFITFSNGMPSQVNVSLTFRELLALTKETIEQLEKPI